MPHLYFFPDFSETLFFTWEFRYFWSLRNESNFLTIFGFCNGGSLKSVGTVVDVFVIVGVSVIVSVSIVVIIVGEGGKTIPKNKINTY